MKGKMKAEKMCPDCPTVPKEMRAGHANGKMMKAMPVGGVGKGKSAGY